MQSDEDWYDCIAILSYLQMPEVGKDEELEAPETMKVGFGAM
jgi:hypothetical protein